MILIGNWKMAPDTSVQAINLAKKIDKISKKYKKNLKVLLAVPFIHTGVVAKSLKSSILTGQSISSSKVVASTGSISASMARSYGIKYCIVGHSESRARGEDDKSINNQIKNLLEKGIKPVLCVGEKERDTHGWYLSSVKEQIENALSGVQKNSLKLVTIAYEPVWAIGSNSIRVATPSECQEMIIFIKKVLSDIYGDKLSNTVPILYGGSVDEKNASDFIDLGRADGLLVGRVSLDADKFGEIAKSISK